MELHTIQALKKQIYRGKKRDLLLKTIVF